MATRRERFLDDDAKEAASVHAPSVRTITRWTYDMLRAAEHQADAGVLRGAAQVCEWLLTDDRVAGSLSARVDALLGLVPTFEASGDKRRSNSTVRALEVGEDWWEAYPEAELDQIHTWGILLGAGPARHGWIENPDHGNRRLPYPEFWHPETLVWDWRTREWSIEDASHRRLKLDPGDGTWLLHTPYGKGRPWARGLWRSLKNWVLLKQLAKEDFGIAGEKGRTAVVESPDESTFEQRQNLAQEIMDSGSDAAIVLAAGFTMKLLGSPAGTRELYEAQIKLADLAIAIRIRGGNLTTEVGGDGGTQAAAKVQRATGDQPKLRWDAATLGATIHDQSLVHWAQLNYGDRKLAPWPSWPVEPEEDKKLEAETEEKAFANAKTAEDLGFEVDRKAFLDKYGIDWAKPGKRPEPQDTPPTQPTGTPPAPGKTPAPAPKGAPPVKAEGGIFARLASGFLASKASGFLNGQLYADALTEHATAAGNKALTPTLDAILEELDAATDYDDLRARLHARYVDLDAEQLTEVVRRALIMAELAGRRAVTEDS